MNSQSSNVVTPASMKKRYFMVFVCMFMQAVPFGVAQNIQPLFIPYVVEEFQFSMAGFGLLFTIGALASSIASPILGNAFGKLNIKLIFLIGTGLSSLGFFLFSTATTLPMFYFFNAVCQTGCVFFSSLGVPYIISQWFPGEGRGKALGLAFAGGSIGNVFLQPITSNLLNTFGPSQTYAIYGVVSILASLPVILFLLRLPKEGEIVDAPAKATSDKKETKGVEFEGLGSKAVTKNKMFWIFGLGYAIVGISISALSSQYGSYFKAGLGLDAGTIGMLGSLFAVFCLIGNVGGGILFDKIGTFKTMSLSLVLQAVSIIALLAAAKMPNLAFVYSVAYGLNVFSYMSAPAFMATDLFGKKDSSVNLGFVQLFFAVGFASGSALFGAIVDATGGYQLAWVTMLGCVVVGYVIVLTSMKVLLSQKAELMSKQKQAA